MCMAYEGSSIEPNPAGAANLFTTGLATTFPDQGTHMQVGLKFDVQVSSDIPTGAQVILRGTVKARNSGSPILGSTVITENTVTINTPPTANVAEEQVLVAPGGVATIDATDSEDDNYPYIGIAEFSWGIEPVGYGLLVETETPGIATYTAPTNNYHAVEEPTITVTADDGDLTDSATAEVFVNAPPVINPTVTPTIPVVGTAVTVTLNATDDGPGGIPRPGPNSKLIYAWNQTGGPGVNLSGAEDTLTFTPNQAGTYTFYVEICDGLTVGSWAWKRQCMGTFIEVGVGGEPINIIAHSDTLANNQELTLTWRTNVGAPYWRIDLTVADETAAIEEGPDSSPLTQFTEAVNLMDHFSTLPAGENNSYRIGVKLNANDSYTYTAVESFTINDSPDIRSITQDPTGDINLGEQVILSLSDFMDSYTPEPEQTTQMSYQWTRGDSYELSGLNGSELVSDTVSFIPEDPASDGNTYQFNLKICDSRNASNTNRRCDAADVSVPIKYENNAPTAELRANYATPLLPGGTVTLSGILSHDNDDTYFPAGYPSEDLLYEWNIEPLPAGGINDDGNGYAHFVAGDYGNQYMVNLKVYDGPVNDPRTKFATDAVTVTVGTDENAPAVVITAIPERYFQATGVIGFTWESDEVCRNTQPYRITLTEPNGTGHELWQTGVCTAGQANAETVDIADYQNIFATLV